MGCSVQGKAGAKLYSNFEDDRNQGDFSALPELHSVLSGMKVGFAGSLSRSQQISGLSSLLCASPRAAFEQILRERLATIDYCIALKIGFPELQQNNSNCLLGCWKWE